MRYLLIAMVATLFAGCAVGPAEYGGPESAGGNGETGKQTGSSWCNGAQADLDKSGRCPDRASARSPDDVPEEPATSRRTAAAGTDGTDTAASSEPEPTDTTRDPEPAPTRAADGPDDAQEEAVPDPEPKPVPPVASRSSDPESAPAPAQAGEGSSGSREPRILSHPAGHYAVQLAAGDSREAMRRFARDHGFEDTLTARIETDGNTWHVLLLGVYSTYAEARAALDDVSGQLETQPWIRKVGSLQEGVKRAL